MPRPEWRSPRRVVVLTLAYNRPEFTERALAHLEGDVEHYIVDVGYPLPDPYENANAYLRMAERYGSTYIRTKNRSVGKNWTWLMQRLGLRSGDVMIGLDPDSRPDKGYIQAMLDVYRDDPTVAAVSLNGPHVGSDDARREMIGSRHVLVHDRPVHWSLMSYEVGFLIECGGLGEQSEVYGYTEHWVYDRLEPMGRRAVIPRDFEDRWVVAPDDTYRAWKKGSAQQSINRSFESYLASPDPDS